MKRDFASPFISLFSILLLTSTLLSTSAFAEENAEAKNFQIHGENIPFNEDGVHDPENDSINVFQHPTTAMKDFPRDTVGVIDWVKTPEEGRLVARSDRLGATEPTEPLDLDVIRTNTGDMPAVKFSHAKHTDMMACESCHDGLFEEKAGATEIKMADILTGTKCGVCHGKVAFPPTNNCMRCHSVIE